MTGPQLGICDAHNGVHAEGSFLGKPCVGWMVYEPFAKPVPFPETPALNCAHCDRALSSRDESDELCTDCQGEVSESRIDSPTSLAEDELCGHRSESRIDYVSRIEYRHTHRSINDGSPAMRLAKAVGKIWLMNEDGYTWVANASEWEEIS